MDDILASIRRIIADDQSRHAGTAATAANGARRPVPTPAPTSTLVAGPAASVAAGPNVVRRPPPSVQSPRPGEKSAFAPLRPAPRPTRETGEAPPTPVVVTPHLNPPALPADPDVDLALIDEIASAGAAAALRPAASPVDVAPATATASPTTAAIAESPSPVLDKPSAPTAESAPSGAAAVPPEAPVVEPLVSPDTRASIESSFNALSTSVFMQNSGLGEGMIRDMVKPMLKAWLDDNLPSIVERLVRIEIERVARGGKA